MPPKAGLTKERIAEEAFFILREEGYDVLNARKLAARLGVSTMPLFHYYGSMEEIKNAALDMGVRRYCEYIEKGMADPIPFKGVGRAYIRFAKEEPRLFKMFFMTATEKIDGLPTEDPMMKSVLNIASDIMNGSKDEGSELLMKMWIFVHGIASLEATGKRSFSDEEMGEILSSTFLALKTYAEEENK